MVANAAKPATRSADLHQQLDERGYVVVPDFLDAPTVERLADALERLEPDERASLRRRGVLFARRNLLHLDFVRALTQRQEIVDLLHVCGGSLIPVRAILFDKSPDANWTVP